MVHMKELAASLKDKKAVVPGELPAVGQGLRLHRHVAKATHLDAIFSRSSTTSWNFQGGKYVNTNSNAAEGDRFNPDSVLVAARARG